MQVFVQDEIRMPYFEFKEVTEEDRNASIDKGHFVEKTKIIVIVTPQGSKDRIERDAQEWIQYLTDNAMTDRIPKKWGEHAKECLNAFIKGLEPPANGVDIKSWAAISRAQCEALIRLNIRTVEDLASANEEALTRMGMGGRALKEKAKAWLSSASGDGVVAEQFAALQEKNKRMEIENKELMNSVSLLKEEVLQLRKSLKLG